MSGDGLLPLGAERAQGEIRVAREIPAPEEAYAAPETRFARS
jgi:hypothetical protein